MKNRIEWVDSIKGFAMLSVVLCHIVNGYYSANLFPNFSHLLYSIQNLMNIYQMPLFFFMSGYLFYTAYIDTDGNIKRERVNRQIANLIGLYIVWSVIMGIFKMALSGQVNHEISVIDLFLIPFKSIGVYWYLYVLIIFYFVFSSKLIQKIPFKILASILGVLCIVGSILQDEFFYGYFSLRRALYYAFYFFGGIFFAKKIIKDIPIKIIGGCIVVAILFVCIFWRNDIEIYHIPLVNLITAIVFCIIFIYLFQKVSFLKEAKVLQVLGKNSLEIYVLHVFFTAGSRILITFLNIENVYICIFITLIISIVFPILIGLLLKKIHMYKIFFAPYSFVKRNK